MKPDSRPKAFDITLEQLLRRGDVWRGQSQRFVSQLAWDTGYAELNTALLHKGWPLGSLVEVCQPSMYGHSEWLLFTPSLLKSSEHIVLLNPPAHPFAQALLQTGINLERLLVVQADKKSDFIASFLELARAPACEALLAWQPPQSLTYTDLRKCLLAANSGQGLCVLFRPADQQQQSSPANLRLLTELHANYLQIQIFKQKGLLKNPLRPVYLPLPSSWQKLPPHRQSDQTARELRPHSQGKGQL